MRPNFKKASERDERKIEDIMPISIIDGRILSEIVYAIENRSLNTLSEILKKYKTIPDSQIWRMLQEFNVDFDPNLEVDEELEKLNIYYISFKGMEPRDLKLNLISSISKVDRYNHSLGKTDYSIIVNEDPTDKLFYSNTIINYYTLQQREYDYNRIKDLMQTKNIVFL